MTSKTELKTIPTPEPTTWTLDASHSTVGFAVRHLMISKTRGRFHRFEGAVHLDEEDPSRSHVEVTIDAASLDTGAPDRDEHLRSPDFFDVANHPELTFRSTDVVLDGSDRATVTGELTIRGTTREVVLDVARIGATEDPWGNERIAYEATTEIDRKDFGLTWNQALETGGVLVGDKIKIKLEVETVRAVP